MISPLAYHTHNILLIDYHILIDHTKYNMFGKVRLYKPYKPIDEILDN
jgi:hypothetical protein